jgi:hypothetical protein
MYCPLSGTAHPLDVSMIWITDTPKLAPTVALVSTAYTPVVAFGLASTNPTLRPGLATLSRETNDQSNASIIEAVPASPVMSSAIRVRVDRAGSVP